MNYIILIIFYKTLLYKLNLLINHNIFTCVSIVNDLSENILQ